MNTEKKNKGYSLKVNTILYFSVFAVFILLLLWGSQMMFLKVFYERYQIKDMNKIANTISVTSLKNMDETLENIVYNNTVCIEYTDKYGEVSLYNDMLTGCMIGKRNAQLDEYKRELLNSQEDIKAIKFVNSDYKSKALLYLVRLKEGGNVFVFSMLSTVDSTTLVVRGQLIYITFIVIILALIISLFLSNIISQPIIEITKKSKALAKGNYNVEFPKNGIIEIDELADTLNYLESEVSKTDQYRRDLMANVSHDLKTPLTMIKAYAEMIKDFSHKDKKKMDEHLNIIISETDRLNILVGDILSLSKLQANAEVLNMETYNLREEIDSLVSKYQIIKETEDYHIEVEAPKKIMVKADRNKINQVLYNLVNNALNYTGDDKKVIIKVTEEKKKFLIEIIDSGKGIDPEQIEYIWDRYYKHEKNHKRNIIGTGLGLSIVKNILVSHKFDYGVKSNKGKGSIFYFKIKKDK